MKNILLFGFLLIAINNVFAQNFNVIIQVNDINLNGEIANLYLSNNDEKNEQKIYPNYYPGDLIISENDKENFRKLNDNFLLSFDYYTYKNGNQNIKNFKVKLNKKNLENPYLIINVYDFRNRKYKKWFQYLTKEDYLPQVTFPNSGIYIRQK